jgi:hypothetical protein
VRLPRTATSTSLGDHVDPPAEHRLQVGDEVHLVEQAAVGVDGRAARAR